MHFPSFHDLISRRKALWGIGLSAAAPAIGLPTFAVRTPDGAKDDTDYIQEAHDRCAAAGGGVIRIDRPLTCRSARPVGEGTLTSLVIWGDNIILDFGERGSIDFLYSDNQRYRPMIVGGVGKSMHNGLTLHRSRSIDVGVESLADPLRKGALKIRLPRDMRVKAGDVLFLRSGQLLKQTRTEPDAELAVVRHIEGGLATLTAPLAKGYTRNLPPWGDGPDERSSLAAPFGVANVTDRISGNIELRSPRLRCLSCLQLLSIWSVNGFRSEGGRLEYNNLGVGGRDSRMVVWRTPLRHNGGVNGHSYAIAPSTGCTDWDVFWDVVSLGSNYLHIHEGVARSRFSGALRMAGIGAQSAGLSIVARAYDIEVSNALIDTGESEQGGVLVRGSFIDNVRFTDLIVRNNAKYTAAIRVDTASDVHFATPPRLTGSNKVVKRT